MSLILAQGAEHTDPKNLKAIVDRILLQNEMYDQNYQRIFNDTLDRCVQYAPDFVHAMCGIDCINTYDYSVEEKYDGFSYLNQEGKFFSKRLSEAKGSKGMPIEKSGHLPHLSVILKHVNDLCQCNLHGEIYIKGGISDNVTSILGCTEDEAVRRQNAMYSRFGSVALPHYMLIDLRCIFGKSLVNEPHRVRRALLAYVYHKYIKPIDEYGYIKLTEELHGDPREHFKRIVLSGGEGIIIKRENALYIPGKKPANNWIKGKKKVTHDVILLGLNNNGTGKNANLFGSMEFGHIIDGKIVKCGNCSSGISDGIRKFIYDNADRLIANKQVFEIEAIQESVKSFRNAVFLRLRDDKDWTECLPVNMRIKEDLV